VNWFRVAICVERVFKYGEGDDDGSLEDDFGSWKKELWPALVRHFGIEVDKALLENRNTRRFKIEWHDRSKHISHRHLHCKKVIISNNNIASSFYPPRSLLIVIVFSVYEIGLCSYV
jgi:hypothetical protein